MYAKTLYAATIFLSAFLVFQIQPIIAKSILPHFGGSPSVWTTCMLFFQLFLLGGYGYAHLLDNQVSLRLQSVIHLLLLTTMILLLQVNPSGSLSSSASSDPATQILGFLVSRIGLPYLLLSSTGPLLQRWLSRGLPHAEPYRLYSLSNLGSLLALVSYPFVIEPILPLRLQIEIWSGLCIVFAVLCGGCSWIVYRKAIQPSADKADKADKHDSNSAVSTKSQPGDTMMWFALAGCGTLMLLAVTNQMCQEVAVIPFLWILPLSLYLLSFVFCFSWERIYTRTLWLPLLAFSIAWVSYVLREGVEVSLGVQIGSYAWTLFVACMVCHGELVRLKPDPERLTSFYLSVAAGGALAGIESIPFLVEIGERLPWYSRNSFLHGF